MHQVGEKAVTESIQGFRAMKSDESSTIANFGLDVFIA
jgi:hypothetical protein